mgnify:CR=1 FL=1
MKRPVRKNIIISSTEANKKNIAELQVKGFHMENKPNQLISGISAVFPAYNDGGTIPSMVLTALMAMRQVTDNYEIIVTNDGSSDYTREILDEGMWNVDRGTGVRSRSVFGRQCRYDLRLGFPLLTTKRVYWKGGLHELYWFMAGVTNIKYLVDNSVHIWEDYLYKI